MFRKSGTLFRPEHCSDIVCVYDAHMKSSVLIRELEKAGWTLERVRGSHHVFRHPERAGIVVVPHPKKDLGTGLVAAIRRQAGIQEKR